MSRTLFDLLAPVALTLAQVPAIPPPGQPNNTGDVGQFQIVGNSLVSAQQVNSSPLTRSRLHFTFLQMLLGTANNVYIIDKVENNPTMIAGHPAWASGESSC